MPQIGDKNIFYLVFSLLTSTHYYDPSHPSWEVVVNKIFSFCKFPNYLKGFNPGADSSLFPYELILDNTPKLLPLL